MMKRVTRGMVPFLLLGLLCWEMTTAPGASGASIDFPRFHRLMEARYGRERVAVSHAWEQMLREIETLPEQEKIVRVNSFFHRHLSYQTDIRLWGEEDYWATPLESLGRGQGDCEDYAIAKYVSLRKAGIGDERLRLIYVRARIGGARSTMTQAHMVLGYYPTPTADPLLLDSLIPNILPGSQRTDLTPVFSFNSQGLWTPGATASAANPVARLSRWRQALERIRQEGVTW
ncbi:transglutaminase-like cysteine peptidase [Zobellella denitrificans]|nr:transglutaminase-like cysteine peptidase [Zobellella denitrificans]